MMILESSGEVLESPGEKSSSVNYSSLCFSSWIESNGASVTLRP